MDEEEQNEDLNPSDFIRFDVYNADLSVHEGDVPSTMRMKWLAQSLVIQPNMQNTVNIYL